MSNVVCFLSKDNLLSKSDLIQHNKQINYSFLYYHEAYKTILFLIQGKRITKENNLLTIWNSIPTDRFVNVTSVWIDFGIEIPNEVKRQGNYLVDKEGKKIISKQTFIQGKLTLFFTHHVDDKRYTETKKTMSLITKQANDLLRLGYNPIEKIETNTPKTKYCKKVQTILNKKELTKEQQLNELFDLYIKHQAKRMKRKFEYMSDMDKGFLFNIVLKSSSYNSTADELKRKYSEYKWNGHRGFVKESSIDIIVKHGKFDEIVDIINNYLK